MNPRLLALWSLMVTLPWLLGALTQPRQRLEVQATGGRYEFVPVCGGRVVQVKHGDALLRLQSRHGPLGAIGGDLVTAVDGAISVESRRGEALANETPAPGQQQVDESQVVTSRTFTYARVAGGVDWRWLGLRLGALAGIRFEDDTLGNRRREPRAFPAFALRLGPPAIHLRMSLADGQWDTRPTVLQFGAVLGLPSHPDDHEPALRGFVGIGGDLQDGNGEFATLGFRYRIEGSGAELGLQGRMGSNGVAMGLTFGVPLSYH